MSKTIQLIGKITVVKTLIIPQIIHILSVLPTPDTIFLNQLNEMISLYLWNHKKGKINRNLMAQGYEEGGLKLTHIKSQIDALKIRWVRYLILENEEWVNIFQTVSGIEDWEGLLTLDPQSITELAGKVQNSFWREVMIAWANLVKANKKDEIQKVLNYSIKDAWYIKNPNLKRLQIPLYYAGCEHVADLYDESMNLLTYEDFRTKYININFLDYASLISCLPKTWKRMLGVLAKKPEILEQDLHFKIITQPKTCKFAYNVFIEAMWTEKPHELKWQEVFLNINEDQWKLYNWLPFACTRNTKLQALQYKIVHRILGTRDMLKRCNIADDDNCILCHNSTETITHLFVDCPVVIPLWENIKNWLGTCIEQFDNENIVFGKPSDKLTSLILLLSKYYIFQCTLREEMPNILALKRIVRSEFHIEQLIAKKTTKTQEEFVKKWGELRVLLEEDTL